MTSTAEIERALITALDTIRTNWPVLVDAGSPGSIAAKSAARSLYTHTNDHDDREDDLARTDIVLSLRHEVTLSLNGWAKIIVEDRGLTHALPLGTDTLGLCDLIARHAVWFSGHEAGPDAADELRSWAGKVHAVAAPQKRDWMPLGSCPVEHDFGNGMETCGGKVRAYTGRDPECPKCGTVESHAWWERVMFPDVECSELVTAAELIPLLRRAFGGPPIKPGTLRQWLKRGLVEDAGHDPQGRTLYSRKAVIEALSERVG